ncbi:beta-hydroxyacyl-(acyl-carrier-protein) dehydratase FabZ [Caldicellulosiruptor owensensis OL]|uniref:3-hydroxyacyl-[acyl-carrier-protein] dehydratase FabZ n=1 Tax=Caldicellulosiruptor owensensis (strain ATCC 700167 / DSM 13100 / OL) TaxID=632518 RepID=E4Q4J2_CALOW|nr:3-hydroxyacyl-ACP dehydratase FabZ [Caldicellulosiruptor owensensis]ADQ05271.1 beta-hydroxyacyl-(acyl-carrier-protein) dehydratase FabZ [Caldicellulosiruptor owensensis OL]
MYTIEKILEVLPHRYPFLLVDKIVEVEEGKRAKGIKNVTINEPFFQGHFPGNPVMPGVLIVEAMAQVGAVAMLFKEEFKGKTPFFAGIDKVRFKRVVKPGDVLVIETELISLKGSIGKAKASAYVDGEVVCEGELLFAMK